MDGVSSDRKCGSYLGREEYIDSEGYVKTRQLWCNHWLGHTGPHNHISGKAARLELELEHFYLNHPTQLPLPLGLPPIQPELPFIYINWRNESP